VSTSFDDRTCARAAWRLALTIALGTLSYAVLRYIVFGQVAPAQLPLFVLNKAAAFTGAALLASCLAVTPLMRVWPRLRPWGRLRKHLGLAGFAFSALHVLMNFTLMSPGYYAKLFGADGRMSFQGELAVLAGVLAFAALLLPAGTSVPAIRQGMAPERWMALQRFSLLALALTGLHLAALGVPTWLAPEKWPAGLPPITLIAAALVLTVLVARQLVQMPGKALVAKSRPK